MSTDFLSPANALGPWLIERRRDFHQHPELGYHENRTAGIIAQELSSLGLAVSTGMVKTGVIGLLKGRHPGPTILARVDMDALPVQEANTVEYISQNPGVMHACGHDGHISVGLAVAKMLTAHQAQLHGTVKFVFQPAEELGGAKFMVEEGVLENPRPDVVLGFHLWNLLPIGKVSVSAGPVMAASEQFLIRVNGMGGHGGIPDRVRDPIVAAGHIITALQSIVARNLSPLDSGVVSVTSLKTIESYNVIPANVELKGTIRTFKPNVRELILKRVNEIAVGTSQMLGCSADVDLQSVAPPVVNHPGVADQVSKCARKLLGDQNVTSDVISLVAEDFAFMLQAIPGCYYFVGSANAERGLIYGHHHPCFNFDETALVPASALMASIIASYVLE
jgi:amidohydrolase